MIDWRCYYGSEFNLHPIRRLLHPWHQIAHMGIHTLDKYGRMRRAFLEQNKQWYGLDGNPVPTHVGSTADLWDADGVADGWNVDEESSSRQGNTAVCMGGAYEITSWGISSLRADLQLKQMIYNEGWPAWSAFFYLDSQLLDCENHNVIILVLIILIIVILILSVYGGLTFLEVWFRHPQECRFDTSGSVEMTL